MLAIRLMGGLGNQLFQIFTTIATAMDWGLPYCFPNAEQLIGGPYARYTYWKTFLHKLKPYTVQASMIYDPSVVISEKQFQYSPINLNSLKTADPLVVLQGYFQSYLYFENRRDTIFDLIELNSAKTYVSKKHGLANMEDTVSLHIRMGDYKKFPHIYPILDKEYYARAIRYIYVRKHRHAHTKGPMRVLVFCEDADKIDALLLITEIAQELSACGEIKFERCPDGLNDWEQMILMSLCGHNIIANSSFSWWGAYFNTTIDKIVCYPAKWFKPEVNSNTSTMCPITWNKM